MPANWLRVLGGLLITALLAAHSASLLDVRFIRELDAQLYDIRLRMTMPGGVDPRIIIVDVDEKSLAREGHWPWSREKLAQLVNKLFHTYHIDTLGFDMVFAERDENHGLNRLKQLANERRQPGFLRDLKAFEPELDNDRQFATVLQKTNTVLGYYFGNDESNTESIGMLPPPVFSAGTGLADKTHALRASRYTANLAVLQQAASTAGFFSSFLVDTDGVFRRVPLLLEYEKNLYGSLSLILVSQFLGIPIESGLSEGTGLERLEIGPASVDLDPNAAVLIPYRGKQGSFRYVSATDILHERVEQAGDLANTIAIVGTTAAGLLDHRATPVQSVYAGVEIHANVVAGLLDNRFMRQPVWMQYAEALLILFVGIILSFSLPFLSVFATTVFSAAIWFSAVGVNIYLWQSPGLVMPLASSLLLMAAIYALNMIWGFFTETHARRLVQNTFGQYVPPEIVQQMSHDPEAYSLKSEKREMTVLFADIRDFTTISESLDPQELSDLMNHFLTAMTGIIHHNHGTIDKYMGDAIMAFWGAPLQDEKHSDHALNAALEMRKALGTMNQTFSEKGWPEIKIGIGINTGAMSVGNMGSEFRMAYTVLGDSVNLGSRLEGLTRVYGAPIVANESTVNASSGYLFRELDRVRVKGKKEPTTIFQLLGRSAEISTGTLKEWGKYQAALKLYQQKNWSDSERAFSELIQQYHDDILYNLYRERAGFFLKQPPDSGWDGIFDHKQK